MTTAYQDLVLFDKPAMYLPLNDASGDFIDLTGNGYNASPFGTLTRNSTFATVGGAGGLVSTGGYAITQKGNLPFGDSWTVEAWVQSTASSSWFGAAQALAGIVLFPGDLVRMDGTRNTMAAMEYYWSAPYTLLQATTGDVTTFTTSNSSQRDDANNYIWINSHTLQYGDPITIPKSHVVIRMARGIGRARNANAVGVYKNGVWVLDTYTQNLQRSHNTIGCSILGLASTLSTINYSPALNTWVSNVAMYPYALSDAQITAHYNLGMGTLTGNRVAGSVLLDGAGTAGFPVFIHRRDTGQCLARTISGSGGFFEARVGAYAGQVYAVAFDTVSGRSYNAQVFDLIVPST